MGDAINVFLFPDLSPSAGSEAALLVRRWDAILGGGALTFIAYTSLMLVKQKAEPLTSWEEAEKQLESWGVFCHVFLGDADVHPTTYKLYTLIEETAYVGARLWDQIQNHPSLPVSLLHFLHKEFNESFMQALERQQQVRWPDFELLRRELATGNFRPDNIDPPGGFTLQATFA